MFGIFRLKSTANCIDISKHYFFSKFSRGASFHSKKCPHFSLKGTQFQRGIVASPKKAGVSLLDDISPTLISFKYMRLIKKSIREGGPIVAENEKLAMLLSKAEEFKMPLDFIKFLQRISTDVRTQLGLVEMLLDNHSHLIIQYEDIDLTVTKPYLLKLCEKYDGYLIRKDVKWPQRFEQVGMLFVPIHEKTSPLKDLKQENSVASKFGALSVQSISDAEGLPYLRFYCEPSKLHKVKQLLIKENCEVEEAYVGYIPKHKVSLSNAAKKTLCSVITEMNKIPTIDNIFTNFSIN